MNIKNIISICILLVCLTSCSRSPEKQLIGKWFSTTTEGHMEVFEDGTFSFYEPEIGAGTGTYTFLDDGRLKVNFDGIYALAGSIIMEWSIEGDQLTTIQPDGTRDVMTRTKGVSSVLTKEETDTQPTHDTEAIQLAESAWDKVWLKRDDSWFVKRTDGKVLVQVTGRTTEVKPLELSKADTLNGVEWHGVVNFFCEAQRFYSPEGGASWSGNFMKGWDKWHERKSTYGEKKLPTQSFEIKKTHGSWKIVAQNDPIHFRHMANWMSAKGVRPTPDDIPPSYTE